MTRIVVYTYRLYGIIFWCARFAGAFVRKEAHMTCGKKACGAKKKPAKKKGCAKKKKK